MVLRFVLASLVLLQVIAEEELREATVLHHRRCWWFWCCFFCVGAQDTFDRSLLGNDLIEVLVLTVDALQPAVAFAVRVDAISQPSADLLEGRGFPVRLVPREAFKFGVIRVEVNDLLLADLTSVLDHLLNEQGQFFQERLVAVDDLEELALLQDVVVELL